MNRFDIALKKTHEEAAKIKPPEVIQPEKTNEEDDPSNMWAAPQPGIIQNPVREIPLNIPMNLREMRATWRNFYQNHQNVATYIDQLANRCCDVVAYKSIFTRAVAIEFFIIGNVFLI